MQCLLLFKFPSFNIYSTPLLLLVLQAFIFAFLLLHRYLKQNYLPALFLALLILITGYHRTSYTIGFMEWYDTYRNTKINYWLIAFSLAVGPLLYFYVKSITTQNFIFKKKDWVHFIPVTIFILYKVIIFIYDSSLEGFDKTQNGYLKINLDEKYVQPLIGIIESLQMLLYLAFTFQIYYQYKKKINEFFSNTYKIELNWIRNFLFIYTFLFLYSLFQGVIGSAIAELHWTQRWWYQFFSAIAILYFGIKGYFTQTSKLDNLDYKSYKRKSTNIIQSREDYCENQKKIINDLMNEEKPYLNPDLNLAELSKLTNMSTNQLSETLNSCFQKNFNDFINEYRVDEVKKRLDIGQHLNLSFLGIALDCGFNSKATFNRVFKRITGQSPTEYIKNFK